MSNESIINKINLILGHPNEFNFQAQDQEDQDDQKNPPVVVKEKIIQINVTNFSIEEIKKIEKKLVRKKIEFKTFNQTTLI
jgi:hypothetical protein